MNTANAAAIQYLPKAEIKRHIAYRASKLTQKFYQADTDCLIIFDDESQKVWNPMMQKWQAGDLITKGCAIHRTRSKDIKIQITAAARNLLGW